MAVLTVTQYQDKGRDRAGVHVETAMWPALDSEAVAVSGSSAKSGALLRATTLVRVCADVDCHVVCGPESTVVATTDGMLMAAGIPEWFAIPAESGSTLAVAVIEA